MTEQSPILNAKHVDHSYRDVSLLEDVSLSSQPGEVVALIVPNGAGKSTLIGILTGLFEPTGGTINYNGPDAVRQIGYLPQHPAFCSGFTVCEILSFYASPVGGDEVDTLAHLRRVGLADAADRNVDDLPGGMTRLVGIAQATIGEPPVVVLDEPGSGLDPGMTRNVYTVVESITETGAAVMLSSHDLALVERHADRITLVDESRVNEAGAPTEVCQRLEADSLFEVFEASTAAEAGTVRVQGDTA
ncbi:ABC transporter ATP-binding protein [Natronolimnohabitans innermongolicus]|uniref:ABC transporter n=1 Tax=Natronolimnohabitans innermongolicus JCM 12255 TaxID=1227499 RepID=L9WNR0_9EURY|nr:ABC transporter ATP-binding protein [Natronolimnohabitans innermongolicus]ELY51002.1 ABC transporter [Natronolimnohabitans innermongolicus JCM 12255]